jgi:predicted ABC-type ATPase
VLKGGHNVPQDDIIRRYYRSRKLFWNVYRNLADKWILFFNGDDNFELVAEDGNVIDEELFNSFLEEIENE